MKFPALFGALRRTLEIRDYRLFVIGNLASNIGLWTQRIALGWLTWELTESPAWLGAMSLAEAAPIIVLSLFAGAVVDRVDYFKLLRLTQSLSLLYALAMAVMTLSGLMTIWILLGIVIFRGCVVAFNRTSRMTAIFSLVGRDMLASAVALNSVIFNVSRFVGPAIGGTLIASAGVGWTFAVAAGLFFVFTVTLWMISTRVASPPERESRSIIAETLEGLRYMAHHQGIRIQIVILVVISFVAKPVSDLFPAFVDDVFSQGSKGLAVLTGAYGFGAMVGAFRMVGRQKGVTGLTAVSIGGILIVAIADLLFALTPWFWLTTPIVAVIGYAFIVQNIANQTLIQMSADPAMRGRVISNHGLVQHGTPAIGALVMGVTADHFGLQLPVAVGAVLCFGLWYWVWRQRKTLAVVLESAPAEVREKASTRG